jgi:D-alanine--D-alanine ligase
MEVEGELKALPIVMIAPHSGSYDFHSKYTKGATDYLVPAPLSEEVTAYVQGLAIETYKVLGLSGVARIDVMLDAENIGYVLEANTIPGMTATSLVPKEAAAVGISFQDLCEMILLSAK